MTENAKGTEVLAKRIDAAHVPAATAANLRFGTWNIRELGTHPRLEPSVAILAVVIASFDLVTVVEVGDDVSDLRRVVSHLGQP